MNAAIATGLPWIQALGWALLHFLWQGAVVGAVFALLRASIPKHHCNARYVNGLVALLALAVLPVATLLRLHSQQIAQIQSTPPTTALPAMATQAGEGVAATFAMAPLDGALAWIVALWLAGVFACGLRSWSQWRALVRVARQWAVPDAGLQQITAALATRFEFVRHIRVLVSDRIDTPTLIGWIKPVILLPTAVALGFPRQQIELILAHELGHLRRCDHLVNLAQALLETLLFYHPVVHWIAREVRNEREICCDELVLRVTCGEPREYASALAALEELRQPPIHLALAASGGVLLERVRRILFVSHPVATRVGVRLWLPVVVALVMVLTTAVRMEHGELVYVDIPSPGTGAVSGSATSLTAPDVGARILRPRFAVAELSLPASGKEVPASSPAAVSGAEILSGRVPAVAARQVASPLVAAAPRSPTAVAERLPTSAAPNLPEQANGSSRSADDHAAQAVAAAPVGPPVATRTVAPEYPESAGHDRGARVELNFTIAADGRVHDIALNEGSSVDVAFVRAATRALRQWRFSPASLGANESAHYRQDFVFAPKVQPDGCVRRTGSLLCQRGEADPAREIDSLDAGKPDLMAAALIESR